MESITATEARKRLYTLLDEVYESHEAIHITGKRHSGVLVSEEDWDSICETLHLSAIPGMQESIIEGMKTPISECDTKPEW